MHMQYKVNADDALRLPSFGRLYALTGVVALLVLADLALWWLGYDAWRNPGGYNLAMIAAVVGGARIVYGALSALLEGDWGADLALAVALLASLALKEYWVGAEVVLIAMVGESLEALTFARTHRELSKILELRPRRVRVRRGNDEFEVAPADVRVDDIVVIRPGERVPVDGVVVAGRSAVDQSTLTGESLPVDKDAGDLVHAGTMNQFGALEVRTTAVGEATILGQVIQLVVEAQQHKSRIERTADQLAHYFLPLVLGAAAVTFLFTNSAALASFRSGQPAAWVWMPTLAVLVVTCPCALILATPAATMAALAWLARRGVLIRGGIALERLAQVTRVAFDKTGTLTTGQLRLGDIIALDDTAADDVLRWAATAEQRSEHLVARALLAAANQRQLAPLPLADFRALPGAGVSAVLEGSRSSLLVGNRRLLENQGWELSAAALAALERLDASGQTPLLVALDRHVVGAIGVLDTVRPEAAEAVRKVRELGIADLVMLTGDRAAVAAQVARAVGIDRWEAELRPDDKARFIATWKIEPRVVDGHVRKHVVAMIGDGVNDAPALAGADVGIAVARVGNDLAAEAADLILLGDPLATLPDLWRLARATQRVIRQNILVFAFFVNVLGIVLTAWIMPRWSPAWLERSPVAAALFHQVGSVLVLLNSMRLLWFERWQSSWLGRIEDELAAGWERIARGGEPLAWLTQGAWRRRWQVLQAAVLASLLVYALSGLTVVDLDEVAVVRRFGGYQATLDPGLHWRLPPPWETVAVERPQRVRTLQIGLPPSSDRDNRSRTAVEWNTSHEPAVGVAASEEILLTGDQSLVELAATIQYRIVDVKAWLFSANEPERLLRSAADGVLRETIATQPLLRSAATHAHGEILTTARAELQRVIREGVQRRAAAMSLGVEILDHGVCLEDVHPPLAVVGAFRDVSSAFKEQERMRNEADAVRRDLIIKAGGETAWRQFDGAEREVLAEDWSALRGHLAGDAAALINQAQAYSILQQGLAAGKAEGFVQVDAAAQSDPRLTAWRLYITALGEALAQKKKLIVDDPSGARRQLWLGAPSAPPLVLPPLEKPEPEG